MSEVRIRENESLESALKRFKRQCAKSGVLAEARKREHYEKPSVKRKKKPKPRVNASTRIQEPFPDYREGFFICLIIRRMIIG